jgi:hypothetical protein
MNATKSHETYEVRYDEETETYLVVNSSGEECDSYETKMEATKEMLSMNRTAEMEWLRGQIDERLNEVEEIGGQGGVEAMRRLADFIGCIR